MKLNDTPDVTGTQAAHIEAAVPPKHWYALAVMTLIYACHFLDRMMVSIIIEPVRKEFALNDSQIGLLTGLAYGASFAAAGIPIGLMIDRVNRVRLLAMLVAIWSAMTTLSGMAQSYVQLLLARMGVGASEAGGSPTSLSLISDMFPASRRSTAVGCFFLSNAVGAIMSILIGGYVAAHHGWRAAMLIAGAPGLLLAVVLFVTVREPRRGAMEPGAGSATARPAAGIGQMLRHIGTNATMYHILAGVTLTTAGVATIGAWLPSFVMRFHGFTIKDAGFAVALASGFCGALGSAVGGYLTDKAADGRPRRRMDVSAGVCLAATATAAAGMLAGTGSLAVGLLSLTQMLAFIVFPAAFGAMLGITAPNMRGATSASLQVCTNLAGYGLGPFMVGVFSDWYGGDQSLRYAMITVMSICFPWAALHFILGARTASDN
ncbi:spinster family MFS transporter [Massilia putida]|uniref:spinster family MFS transporter n=1 Tax=Massilia putida TaxID=1141883 RepID=UPI0009522C03|nr:MFS transporter [Massilia putida]